MEFMDCVKNRRSIRKFAADVLSDEVLARLIKAASYSPSWKNSQTVRYYAVRDAVLRDAVAENCVTGFAPNAATIRNAAAIILVATVANRSGYERDGSFSTSKGTHWESFDAGIATQTLCLSACEEGLGTVVLGIFDEAKLRETVGVPDGQKISAIVAIGTPNEAPEMPKRKDVADLLTIVG